MTTKPLSLALETLIGEFLNENAGQEHGEETKRIWAQRDDLAEAFEPYVHLPHSMDLPSINADLSGQMAASFPDALYWQLALFRVCGRRAVHRRQKEEEDRSMQDLLTTNKNFGMF